MLHVATAALSTAIAGAGSPVAHEAYLKRVGEIRQSLFSATDRVSVVLKNHDNVRGLEVASGIRTFNNADADVGRYFTDESTSGHKILFTGKVAMPEVTESEVRLDVIDPLTAAGIVIAARNLGAKCPFRYKDALTCGSTDASSTCSKNPYSKDGCAGRNNVGRFGGWMWPFPKVTSIPTGEPTEPIIIGGGETCFVGDTMVTMWNGSVRPIRDLKVGDLVLCFYYDEEKGIDVITRSPIERVFSHDAHEYYEFGFSNGNKLKGITPEHPIYAGKGAFQMADWARLKQKYGSLNTENLSMSDTRLNAMKWTTSLKPVKVYNLHVGKHHTYFADNVPVHNKIL